MKFSNATESNKAYTRCPSILASTTELWRQPRVPAQEVISTFQAEGCDEQGGSEQAEAEVGFTRGLLWQTFAIAVVFHSCDTSVLKHDKNSNCAEVHHNNKLFSYHFTTISFQLCLTKKEYKSVLKPPRHDTSHKHQLPCCGIHEWWKTEQADGYMV